MCLYIIGKHWGSFLSHCNWLQKTDWLQDYKKGYRKRLKNWLQNGLQKTDWLTTKKTTKLTDWLQKRLQKIDWLTTNKDYKQRLQKGLQKSLQYKKDYKKRLQNWLQNWLTDYKKDYNPPRISGICRIQSEFLEYMGECKLLYNVILIFKIWITFIFHISDTTILHVYFTS